MSGLCNPNFSPARATSPQIRSTRDVDWCFPFFNSMLLSLDVQYLSELLAKHQKLGPFMQVLPICRRLLNQAGSIELETSGVKAASVSMNRRLTRRNIRQTRNLFPPPLEIFRVTGMMPNQGFTDFNRLRHRSPSPMASPNIKANVPGAGISDWNGFPPERLDGLPGMAMEWQGAPASASRVHTRRSASCIWIFQLIRTQMLLGPRGNSLKRVETTTGCRVYIRGKGSIKDPDKEKLRGKPGYEHLNDQLHILIEADFPANIVDTRLRHAQEIIEELLKPAVDESQDYIKRQQLRELAMLNSNVREDSPGLSGSVSPFNSNAIKRPKTGC